MKQEITLLDKASREVVVDAHVDGDIAVHRRFDALGWTVSHVPTGMNVANNHAMPYKTAQKYAKALRALKCWDWGKFGDESGMPEDVYERTKEVYVKIC